MTDTFNDTKPTTTARSIGTATISFGLVACPVKLYSTNESVDEISFNLLHDADSSRLEQVYRCKQCKELVDREHQVKGYEHAKGCYVTFTADELKALDAVATEQIAIVETVPLEELDGLYLEKSYYLGPDKGAEKVYALLTAALNETGLVGIGQWSARGKEHVVAVRPYQDGILVHQLRYTREVKAWDAVPARPSVEIKPAELKLAKQLLTAVAEAELDLTKYKDRNHERTAALIQQKIESGTTIEAPEGPVPNNVIDLMEALKASIDKATADAPKKNPKAAPTPIKKAKTKAKRKRAA